MASLLKKLITSTLLSLSLFFFLASPAKAAGTCIAPEPGPALDLLIKEAQQRGGAAAVVDASILKAIYNIEATEAYRPPPGKPYVCKKNTSNALGLMQTTDEAYEQITLPSERFNDEYSCQTTNCKLSRCNPVDSIELAARELLNKIYLWDREKQQPTGSLKTSNPKDVFYASCRYYGIFTPDTLTTQLAGRLNPNQVPADGTLTYCEFVTIFSGAYSSPSQFPPRTDAPHSGVGSLPAGYKFEWDSCLYPEEFANLPTDFDKHPLRPFPKETLEGVSEEYLTTYCAMRPVAVEQNRLPIDERMITVKTIGNMTLDFTSFITPLLSVTDPQSPDYQLTYSSKAQRYLLDFLEGRAYYEAMLEPTDPTPSEQRDIWNRLGVFRKMAPKSYQDKLKRAVIQRATNTFQGNSNPYGFTPATNTLHNYVVGYWNHSTHQLANWETHTPITLKDFQNNWAPLSNDFETTEEYQQKYKEWFEKDYGMWSSLWPYVPMFTREDTRGYIEVIKDEGAPGPQVSTHDDVDVIHPHLARAYEVSTSLSYLLTPSSVHSEQTDTLKERWFTPAPWWMEGPWWMDPTVKKPHDVSFDPDWGVICDYKDNVPLISTSGDKAFDSIIKVSINRQETVENPKAHYRPELGALVTDNCGTHKICAECKQKRDEYGNVFYKLNEDGCFYYKEAFYTPNYLVTHTPYLKEILSSLFQSKRAVFNLFTPYESSPTTPDYENTDWPGVGNPGEDSPEFDYSANSGEQAHAEAGYHRGGNTQSYLYRYLGTIQCAKEKVVSVLQPFFSGEKYIPYSPECFAEGEGNVPKPYAPGNPICHFDRLDLPFANTSSNPIAHRAWEIVSDLYQGFWCYWNRSPGDYDTDETKYPDAYPHLFNEDLYEKNPFPTTDDLNSQFYEMFWCTQLVYTSFSENGSQVANELRTDIMADYFKANNRYLDATASDFNINQVSSGDAIFFRIPEDGPRFNHVAIVYDVSVAGITTVESNAGYKSMFYPFNQDTGSFELVNDSIKVEGFGLQ